MRKFLFVLSVLAGTIHAQTVVRQFDFVTDQTAFPASQDVTWMQGESVRFNVASRRGNYPVTITATSYPVIRVWFSNTVGVLYAAQTGSVIDASAGRVRVDLNATEAAISPTGSYNYAIAIYDGTNYMGVAASGKATVRGFPFSGIGYVGTQYPFPGITGAVFLGSAAGGITGQTITIYSSGLAAGSITGNQHNAILGGLTVSNELTVGGALNANDNIEIAADRHIRFQDGNTTNRITLDGLSGRLIISGGVDIVTTKTNAFTVNGVVITNIGSGGGGSGTLTGAVVGAGSSTRLTATNSGAANVTLNLDATGLATGTPIYVETDSSTNVTARLSGDAFSNQFTGVIATNVGGNARVVLVDGVTSQLSIYAGGYRASTPSQGTVGGRILMYSTNGASPGSVIIGTVSSTGLVSISSAQQMAIVSPNGTTFSGYNATNIGTIYLTNGLTTAGSETAAIPIYGAAMNNKVTINSGFSNIINEIDNFVDIRTASNYVLRLYSLQTNLMAAREILDLWNYDAGTNVLFASGFGIQSGWGAHSPTQAVYQFAIATTARGTNNLSNDAQFKISSPSVNGLLTAVTIKSEGDVVVTGRVTAASFAGDGSALTNVAGSGGAAQSPWTNTVNAAGFSVTNATTVAITGTANGTNTTATISIDPTNRWIKVVWTP